MKYRCRTTKPNESKWFEVEAESPEEVANSFHAEYDKLVESVVYYPDPEMLGSSVRFALIEVEGHGTWISRLFVSKIVRRGGIRQKPLLTLAQVAMKLGFKHPPEELMQKGWEQEERTGAP